MTSRLLISGFVAASVSCGGAGSCSENWGLYLDGQPLPGTTDDWTQGMTSTSPIRPVDLVTITGALPAGTHTVRMADDLSGNVVNTFQQRPHLSVVALGP